MARKYTIQEHPLSFEPRPILHHMSRRKFQGITCKHIARSYCIKTKEDVEHDNVAKM